MGAKTRGKLVTAEVINKRGQAAAKSLIEASHNNRFLRKTLVRIYWVLQGGELVAFVGAVGIAYMVDTDRMALNSMPVALTIGDCIPDEVWQQAHAAAEAEPLPEPAAA